eukprot:TRINITY_DN559_c0_g1_i1.p1 TRINITY_DN559_c0_g1~~TRINITY_DN559_c0_g1_i1.p1  ORF type:complete len:310 (-),score=82.74 TRINITY_DN559_c0_g1_i1:142-1071(-)
MGQLQNEAGEVTSHISGMFYRTLRLLDNGIKPVYVFDGKPPNLKGGELEKRKERREKAAKDLKEAKEADEKDNIDKYERRLVRVTKEHCNDVKVLLRLMGIPVVDAPGEAEAQCATMCKAGLVYATATEDMDALTFGTPVLVRHMMTSAARKEPIHEYNLEVALQDLGISMEQFRDICILCGCDYTTSIRGIGQHRALDLIKKHKTIENLLKNIDKKRFIVSEEFLYEEARGLFENPNVDDCSEMKLEWTEPKEEELIKYMVDEKGFSIERVQSGIARLKKSRGKGTQTRLESFLDSRLSNEKTNKRSN